MTAAKIRVKKSDLELEDERKNRVKALLGSITTYALLLLLLFFVGMTLPEEPEVIEEPMGADVMLGENPEGMGETFEAETSEPITPQYIAQNFSAPEVPTENTPDAPRVKVNPNSVPNPGPPQDKPADDPKPNDLFTKSDPSKKPGGGKGDDKTPGTKGLPNGLPDGKGLVPGGGQWALEGGNLNHIPRPVDVSQVFGTLVIEITVNKAGKVTGVRGGVTGTLLTGDPKMIDALIDKYERKAWEAVADANPNGPDRRIGTITYKLSAR